MNMMDFSESLIEEKLDESMENDGCEWKHGIFRFSDNIHTM